jgi:hypothetical protein
MPGHSHRRCAAYSSVLRCCVFEQLAAGAPGNRLDGPLEKAGGLVEQARRPGWPGGSRGLIQLQSVFGIFPLGAADPTARQLGAGWRQLGAEIDSVRYEIGANGIVTASYAETAWLSFYLPSHPPVVQLNERIRWTNEPAPRPEFLNGLLIYVRGSPLDVKARRQRFKTAEESSPHLAGGATASQSHATISIALRGQSATRCDRSPFPV